MSRNNRKENKAEDKIREKERLVGANVQIISPKNFVDPQIQANWLIQLLNKMYFEHGVSKNVNAVIENIKTGKDKYWFALENDRPVAVVGLINQGNKVEIGRAVSFAETKGLGGLLYLKAASDFREHSQLPLVAEVRVSDEFLGIPGSIQTMILNYDYLQFIPHALIPMFGHGNPYRQEYFLLGSDQKIKKATSVLPANSKAAKYIEEHGLKFADNFVTDHKILNLSEKGTTNFEIVTTTPITVAVPSKGGSRLDTTERKNPNKAMLIVVELKPDNMSAITHLLNNDFVPVGIDSLPSNDGNTVLLFHKLDKRVLVAPTVFRNKNNRTTINNLFSNEQLRAIYNILKVSGK